MTIKEKSLCATCINVSKWYTKFDAYREGCKINNDKVNFDLKENICSHYKSIWDK